MTPICGICGGTEFVDFSGRKQVKCTRCSSLERHRIADRLYARHGLYAPGPQRHVLHLAPERMLAGKLMANRDLTYLVSDPRTDSYNWTRLMRLFLPDDFKVFHDGYFDAILHNHVLEHIPGSFVDHLAEFRRILAPGGVMIFSLPGPRMSILTEEGGEHIDDPAERLRRFGQDDHLKLFGRDLIETMENSPGMGFQWDGLSDEDRAGMSIPPGSNRFMIWQKLGG